MNLEKLERDLWEAAENRRANSKLTAAQYAMHALELIFLPYAYTPFFGKLARSNIRSNKSNSPAPPPA